MESKRATATSGLAEPYAVAEVARRLGININLAYAACHAGEIPGAFKIGGRWLIARQRFDEFMRTGERVVTGKPAVAA